MSSCSAIKLALLVAERAGVEPASDDPSSQTVDLVFDSEY